MSNITPFPKRGRLYSADLMPRQIRHENVQVGDLVSVEFAKDRGVIMSKRGRVARITEYGRTVLYMTEEGSVIFARDRGTEPTTRITLIERVEVEPQPLFNL